MNDMENVLESIGVTKNYAGKAAVDNVSLKLETGLVYAMLGPNGKRQDYLDEDGGRPCQTWKRGDFI